MRTPNYKQEAVFGGKLVERSFAFFLSAVTALVFLQLRFFLRCMKLRGVSGN